MVCLTVAISASLSGDLVRTGSFDLLHGLCYVLSAAKYEYSQNS